MFQWIGGNINLNGQTLTNTGVMTLANTSATGGVVLNGGGTLANQKTLDVTGTGGLGFANSATLDNQAGAAFDFQADASTFNAGNSGTFTNEGTLTKTGGTGTSTLGGITFVNNATTGNTPVIDIESGTLQNAAGGTSTGGAFVVAQGATLDLTGGQNVSYDGTYTGSGSGSGQGMVEVAGGTLTVAGATTFDFPNAMFQWTGGTIALNNQTLTNTGVMTLANSSSAVLNGAGTLANQGTIGVTGTGGLGFANSATLDNQGGATFDFQADASTFDAGNSGTLTNEGTLSKTGGTGTSTLAGIAFVNNGTLDVESGTLQNAAVGTSIGGAFVVAQGAALDLTGGRGVNYEGTYTSSGQGVVELTSGTLNIAGATTFDFPASMFQWTGGAIALDGNTLTNTGVMTLANTPGVVLNGSGTLANQGTIDIVGTGGLGFANGAALDDQAGATFDFQADASTFDAGNSGALTNEGTLSKTGGTGTSTIGGISFANSGTINVDSGTLALANGAAQFSGNALTGGTWNVFNGATLDVSRVGPITTNDGNVTLSGSGAAFAPIDGLAVNNGSFSLLDGCTFTTAGDLTNNGILTIGGPVDVTGSYTQAADATLNEQLGGTPTSSQFGVLAVAGQASLAGTLAIATVNGFGPLTGQVFDVAGYSLTSGTFSSIQGQTINGIPTFTTAVNSGGIVVTAVANAADLTPTSVSLPASVLVGQPLTVHYTVSNLQPAATLASAWTDSVYLSADGTIDSSSILLGTVAHSGAVSGNGDYSASLTATVPPAPPGNYQAVVLVDSGDQVPDADRANNALASASAASIDYQAISPGNPASATVQAGQDLYYRIDVPAGSDVMLTGTLGRAALRRSSSATQRFPPPPATSRPPLPAERRLRSRFSTRAPAPISFSLKDWRRPAAGNRSSSARATWGSRSSASARRLPLLPVPPTSPFPVPISRRIPPSAWSRRAGSPPRRRPSTSATATRSWRPSTSPESPRASTTSRSAIAAGPSPTPWPSRSPIRRRRCRGPLLRTRSGSAGWSTT